MNKFLLNTYLNVYTKIISKTMGLWIWKNVLRNYGIEDVGILHEDKKDEVFLKIYNDFFKENQKNKQIFLKNIGKTYENGFKAVHNFNLEVSAKEFVCLLGPSGCGKTTVLRMVAGLESITEGKYISGSQEINALHPSERDTAMVFQNYALYPFMNVYNNIAFGLKLKTYKNTEIKNLMQKINKYYFAKNEEILDLKHRIYQLSHEMKGEIIEKSILKRKLLKMKKIDQVQKLSQEISALKVIFKSSKARNAQEINQLKAKIKKLYEEQKKLFYDERLKAKTTNEKNSLKIKKLKQEQTLYRTKKAQKLPEINSKIKALIKDLKLAKVDLGKIVKQMYLLAKKNPQQDLSDINQEINQQEDQIIKISNDILNAKGKILMIKKCNKFKINKLKNNFHSIKSWKKELVKAVIIWKKTIPSRIRKLSSLVGIRDYLKRKPAALSGGQRQRVALIRAISKNCQLFLFDEPLSNLDAKLRATMRSEIRKIHQSIGATSLYVTHDQIEAMTMADKVVVINLGYIQQVGSPHDLYENPANLFVARFIGTPTINIIKVSLNNSKTSFSINNHQFPIKLAEAKMKKIKNAHQQEVLLGVRPNDVILQAPSKSLLTGTIVDKELIGSEYVVSLLLESGQKIKALVGVQELLKIGQKFGISFVASKISFFDQKTGKSISSIMNKATAEALKVWTESTDERIKNLKILANDRDKKTITTKMKNKVKEATNHDFKKQQLMKKISDLAQEPSDYSVFDEGNINS